MITIRCQCGEIFHADEIHVGSAIKCSKCGQILGIGASIPTATQPLHADIHRQETHVKSNRRPKFARWMTWIVLFVVAATVTLVIVSVNRDTGRPPVAQNNPTGESPQPSAPAPLPLLEVPKVPIYRPPKIANLPMKTYSRIEKVPLNRLKTGTNISEPVGTSGRGTLRIYNGTNYDAAVTLLDVSADEVRRFTYVRAGAATTLNNISPCQGRLFFALGHNWDTVTEDFLEDNSYSVFDEALQFEESRSEKGIEWASYSVTLHPVPEGKARTRRLSREEFLRQVHKRRNDS